MTTGQSKRASFIESVVNTMVGLFIAFYAQVAICWAYDIQLSARSNAIIVFWMTVLSVLRSYVVRRIANKLQERRMQFEAHVESGIRNNG